MLALRDCAIVRISVKNAAAVGGIIKSLHAARFSPIYEMTFSNTTASAAIPSPRPIKPSFSLVFALILVRSSGRLSSAERWARMAGIYGKSLGDWELIVQSGLMIR